MKPTLCIALLLIPAIARAACEMVPHPSGTKYMECDPAKIKEAKDAAAAAAATAPPPPKPGHTQSVEEFKANMDAINARNEAERAEATARAEAARVAEEKRRAEARAKEEATFKSSGTRGKWIAKVEENKMDRRSKLTLRLDGTEPLPNRVQRRYPALIIRCEAGNAEVYLAAGTQVHDPNGDLYGIRFRARFDDGEPDVLRGEKSTSYDSIFFPDPHAYVKKLRSAKVLMLEVTPFGFNSSTTTFRVEGLDQHRAAVLKHCEV